LPKNKFSIISCKMFETRDPVLLSFNLRAIK
jgi:hypothetical protein